MDYDRWDAVLHYIFQQTQGDEWFRPDEHRISSGVAIRIAPGYIDPANPNNNEFPQYRIFPYERMDLEPFEQAVVGLNPMVAVKVRNAAVHASLAETSPQDSSMYVDVNTRIQILDTMLNLPGADKEQCAAFIRDERVLVVWSQSLDSIVPICNDFEERLIKLLWRSRPSQPSATSDAESVLGAPLSHANSIDSGKRPGSRAALKHNRRRSSYSYGADGVLDDGKEDSDSVMDKKDVDLPLDSSGCDKRPTVLYASFYNGVAAAVAFVFIGNNIKILLGECILDGSFIRLALLAVTPLLYCISLFFCLHLIQNLSMAFGPVAQYHDNSKYYSAIKPQPNKVVDNNLPHITIQMPVYKESLEKVLIPSIMSLKKAMQTYARQGGSSTIFINDDGMRAISETDRDERIAFYANHDIGWVARPKHDESPDGFKRQGRFKKASNMNYALQLSLKAEKHLEGLVAARKVNPPEKLKQPTTPTTPSSAEDTAKDKDGEEREPKYGMQYHNRKSTDMQSFLISEEDLEENALVAAIEETFEESGKRFKPWAANGKACRLGEIVLLVDSDTIVPEDCLRDAAREMADCPTVGIIQHDSDVLQVAHHFFENGMAYFTRRVIRCISIGCANGEVAPFMGHNAFLRWKALQDASFIDPDDGQQKIWSESNVSEDFDMALRLIKKGYILRWATYHQGGFKEGVSLTIDDEISRWQKYAYGCSELLFNPFKQWWYRGPIAQQVRLFLWSAAPLHYKFSSLAYMFSYYGISATLTLAILNYVLLGFQFTVDGFYTASFEIFLAASVVFYGTGTIGYALLEYRLGHKSLLRGILENVMWIPYLFFFFGGMAIPVSQALLAHMFSYNITWSATSKEVQRSNFFKEVPKNAKRFWFPVTLSFLILVGIVVCSTPLVPYQWHVGGEAWAVIFPLAMYATCHILLPASSFHDSLRTPLNESAQIVLNPWLMIFSY